MKSALIAARHGDYTQSLDLSEFGKQQTRKLAEAIRVAVDGYGLRTFLLCSTAPRAMQGGEILAEILQIPKENVGYHECLWEDKRHPGSLQEACRLVNEVLQDGVLLIVMSHVHMAPAIVNWALTRKYGNHLDLASEPKYGQGILVAEGMLKTLP